MPGTTAYPAALDTFPDIGANTPENVSGISHSGAHNNEAAAIAALQAKVGIDGSADPDSLDARLAAVEAGGGGGSTSGAIPFFIADGETYTVAANTQALFTLPIELDGDSFLIVDGALVEVD